MCIGAIIGDICGSIYEGSNKNPARKNFTLFGLNSCFTDDTVLTIATMDAILNSKKYDDVYSEYYKKYPYVGYGKAFKAWAKSDNRVPYGSYGNGSAMRVSPLAYVYDTKREVMEEAKKSASVTHNSIEGIRGAQAVALAAFMARMGDSKNQIKDCMTNEIGYDLLSLKSDNSCQGSVPNAIVAFLNSTSYVDTIRSAILMGGDSDTIACMAGGIAQNYYGVGVSAIPSSLIKKAFKRLPEDLAKVVTAFTKKYVDKNFVEPENVGTKSSSIQDALSLFS